jgi:DnaD/phage-associated family protein
MIYESNMSILYSDTQVPDVFITEYMPSMESDFVKVYIYCVFLAKRSKLATPDDISKKLCLETGRVKEALTWLENMGVIQRNSSGVTITDLKEKEIKKLYRPKTTSTPEEAAFSSERNIKRSRSITAINNRFFQGVMSPSWYTDIDAWFDKYQFEEDVMFALFQHCYDHKGLAKQYIIKVADNWHSKNIKNQFDLDKYSMEYQKLRDIRLKIMKKIRKQGYLTEYEEAYVEKWVMEFGYDFDIIELALKKTTAILNPNFEYINKILTEWNEKGLKSKEEIMAYEKSKKLAGQARNGRSAEAKVPQKGNFDQRKYDDEFFEKLYKDV